MNKKLAIEKFEQIRDIPYRIPLSANEKNDCCSGKHVLLSKELTNLGYNCRYKVCTFKRSSLNLPRELLNLPHEVESTHVFLEVKIDSIWKIVDATWDRPLSKILPVNTWDGISDTQIAVPVIETFSIERSHEIMTADINSTEEDLRNNGIFYKGFNEYLESVRSSD